MRTPFLIRGRTPFLKTSNGGFRRFIIIIINPAARGRGPPVEARDIDRERVVLLGGDRERGIVTRLHTNMIVPPTSEDTVY